MTGGRKGVGVVYPQEMQVQIKQQGTSVFGVDLKLCHGLHVSSVNVVELIVNHTLEKLVVDVSILLSVF